MEYIQGEDVRDIVNCFVKCTGTLGPMEKDPAYLRMRSELKRHDTFILT